VEKAMGGMRRRKEKWEGRERNSACRKDICFLIFRVRERTRNSDWLISHQGFPNYIPCGLDEFKIAALVGGSIDEVLVISDIQLATDHCIQLKEEQDKAVRDLYKENMFLLYYRQVMQKFDLPSFRTSARISNVRESSYYCNIPIE
jgi:hypothetical protein